ncbi:unnamed protein product, partial [Nesidiocoris tenuis]
MGSGKFVHRPAPPETNSPVLLIKFLRKARPSTAGGKTSHSVCLSLSCFLSINPSLPVVTTLRPRGPSTFPSGTTKSSPFVIKNCTNEMQTTPGHRLQQRLKQWRGGVGYTEVVIWIASLRITHEYKFVRSRAGRPPTTADSNEIPTRSIGGATHINKTSWSRLDSTCA